MPTAVSDNPAYWHELATEARANADRMEDPKDRSILLGIAEQYDRIAAKVEAIVASKSSAISSRSS